MVEAEGGGDVFDKHPIYDLRQIYAKDLLGDTLKRIKMARELREYSAWYGLVRWDFYADLYQKLEKTEIELINKKIEETKRIIAKYPMAFLKKNNAPNEHEIITQAIWDLEVLMKNLSEEHNIYGKAEDDEGL
jgi:hypothetical protein